MIPAGVRIFVCTERVDLRRGFDTLSQAAREKLGNDPQHGGVFVFAGKRGTRLKMLWVDRHRCFLLWVRLHQASFVLPDGPGISVKIDSEQLRQLLEGVRR